jgi:hypothetical protein
MILDHQNAFTALMFEHEPFESVRRQGHVLARISHHQPPIGRAHYEGQVRRALRSKIKELPGNTTEKHQNRRLPLNCEKG